MKVASHTTQVHFDTRATMPKINYSRAALVQHCIDTSRSCRERATRTLDRVVRQQADFLVPYACVSLGDYTTVSLPITPRLLARFNAERWVAAHVKMYGLRFEHETSALYFRLLASALLLTPTLVLEPESLWQHESFVDAFRKQATTLLMNRGSRPLPRHNFAALRAHAVAGHIMAEIEHRIPSEIERYTQLYTQLLATIESGVPPVHVAQRFLSDTELQEYTRLLETTASHVDIVLAQCNGMARQKRGHGTWNAHDTNKALAMLSILERGARRNNRQDVIGEEYERIVQAETRRRNERERDRIFAAQQLGTWRVRKADFAKWRDALTPEEWSRYLRCEHAMRTALPTGLVTRIQRRHFNPTSVNDMRNSNLATLCAQMLPPEETEVATAPAVSLPSSSSSSSASSSSTSAAAHT